MNFADIAVEPVHEGQTRLIAAPPGSGPVVDARMKPASRLSSEERQHRSLRLEHDRACAEPRQPGGARESGCAPSHDHDRRLRLDLLEGDKGSRKIESSYLLAVQRHPSIDATQDIDARPALDRH